MPKSKTCLPDVNVWVALAWEGHIHHEPARTWFAEIESGTVALCRITQMGFLRLVTNRHVMGSDVRSQRNAWQLYEVLARDDRVMFIPEPPGLEPAWKRYTQGTFTGTNVWTDAYLAAVAARHGMTLVSFDRSLERIRDLETLILSPKLH